ncbi:hypothetical protein [Microvirga guangxiensis]|uniref:Uncharacterized protein n=1 Tax=Microvirga guangxiensis TaxID=549386 RepID=A0A1G5DVN1_9HYPH|nr:hypothetical protein [Microvirga guangxiensis]SCY18774.1 hypothetical protein SAMN02927923_00797 [Microvirga guangxiensis]
MDRQIKGIVGATLAAPYIATILLALPPIILENPLRLFEIGFYESVLALGTIGLFWSIVPTLILSLLVAGVLNLQRLRSPMASALAGLAIGLCFGTFFSSSNFDSNWHVMLTFCISGAICGWIYWRIAVRGRSPDPADPQPGHLHHEA